MSEHHTRSAGLRTRWSAIGAAVAITLGAGGIGIAQAAIDSGEKPVTVTVESKRILDTREDLGLTGPFTNATPRDLQVTGDVPVAPSGTETVVPADAIGVLVNVTVVNPTDPGFLALRPGGAAGNPETSTVNFIAAGAVEPNAATVDLSADGKIQVWVTTASPTGTADVLIDVVGYTIDHTHDDRYYTETEADAVHATKADSADVYTKAEIDALTKPLFATILPSGGQYLDASGLVSSTRTATGQYTLTFDQPINTCAVATNDLIWADTRDVSAAVDSGADNQVLVQVTNEADVNEDTYFSILIQCLPTAAAALAPAAATASGAND